jgi:hypothetical protein
MMKPLPGDGAEKGNKGMLMSQGKKIKEKMRRKGGRGGNEKGNRGISV